MWLRRGLVVLLSVACCLTAPRAWAEERVAPDGPASELEELAAQAASSTPQGAMPRPWDRPGSSCG